MDSSVLSLQCGKATAIFVRPKDCDIVAEVSKCGSRGLDLIFPVPYLSNNFTAIRAGTSTSRGDFFFFFSFFRVRAGRTEHRVPYDTLRNFSRFWGTLLRPTAGSAGSKMHHPAKRPLAMCEHTGGDQRDFFVVFHRDICRDIA